MAKKKASKQTRQTEPTKHGRRADLGAPADGYFAKIQPETLNAVAGKLRAIVRAAAPKASESIKWGMPFYELNGMLGYIRARPTYITLGFYHQGVHLPDAKGRLEGSGENMRHVKVSSLEAVDVKLFKSWVRQAVAINAKG